MSSLLYPGHFLLLKAQTCLPWLSLTLLKVLENKAQKEHLNQKRDRFYTLHRFYLSPGILGSMFIVSIDEFLIANSNIFEDPDKQTGLFNETPSFNFFKPNICTRLVWLARSNSIQPMQSRQHPAAAAAGPCQQQPVWSLKMPNWATFFLPHVSSVPFLTVCPWSFYLSVLVCRESFGLDDSISNNTIQNLHIICVDNDMIQWLIIYVTI